MNTKPQCGDNPVWRYNTMNEHDLLKITTVFCSSVGKFRLIERPDGIKLDENNPTLIQSFQHNDLRLGTKVEVQTSHYKTLEDDLFWRNRNFHVAGFFQLNGKIKSSLRTTGVYCILVADLFCDGFDGRRDDELKQLEKNLGFAIMRDKFSAHAYLFLADSLKKI
jgi:hypothetical protein